MRRIYSDVRPITDTTVHLDFANYFVVEPAVLITVYGAETNVEVSLVYEFIDGVGEVYTGVDLTFPAGHVGKKFAILVTADE